MKTIIIKESNRNRIEQELNYVQKRCTARTINFDDIVEATEHIEKQLDIPKKYMVGIEAEIDINAQNFPSAYKYTPDSTIIKIVRNSSGWALESIYRYPTRRAGHGYKLKLTDVAKAEIIYRNSEF